MKLKYFLRGLGAGIILGAMVMLVAYLSSGAYKISDDEIRSRAKRLGMVEDSRFATATASDGPARSMDDQTSKDVTTEEVVAEKVTVDKETKTEKETTTEAATEKTTEERTTTEETTTEATNTEATTTQETTTEAATTEEKTTEEKTTEEKTTEQKPGQKTEVTIKVTAGMYSETVSQMLQDTGLVKSADEFNSFLMKNGYADRIEVGEFKLTSDMSFEEMAKILTTKQ